MQAAASNDWSAKGRSWPSAREGEDGRILPGGEAGGEVDRRRRAVDADHATVRRDQGREGAAQRAGPAPEVEDPFTRRDPEQF